MFWNAHAPDNPSELPMASINKTINWLLQDEMPLVTNTNTFPPTFSKLTVGLGRLLASGKRENEELLCRPSTAYKTHFQRKLANQRGKKHGYIADISLQMTSKRSPMLQ